MARGLTDRDWRLLSYYSWETDEQQLIATKDVPATLQQLAKRCPAADTDAQTRLVLTAASIEASAKTPNLNPAEKAAALQKLNQLLADPKLARQNFDLLTGDDGAIAGLLTAEHSEARAGLVQTWNAELDRLIADTTLSNTDRLAAMGSKISLARLEVPKGPLPAALLRQIDDQANTMDASTTNAYERQSVINAAAGNLTDAGQLDESDRMLKAELTRSHSPYYFMLDLAANAKKRGDTKSALDWYKQAYVASEGPATRLQWGVVYVRAMTELSPQDDATIVATTDQILKDVAAMPNAFYERNLHGLQKMTEALAKWDLHHDHDAGADQIRENLQGVCSALPAGDPQKDSCTGLLHPTNPQHA